MDRTAYIPIQHDDGYYTKDAPLFIGKFSYYRMEPHMVQGKLYVSEERYYTSIVSEIIPLQHKEGSRHYVHLKPYVLEPQLFMTIGIYPKPKHYADQDEAIGEVLKTDVKGMRQHEIGNAQAWYYPQEKTIVLWECFLESHVRPQPINKDENQRQLWQAFEQLLTKQFPDATRIATPFNDPIAETIEEHQSFLGSLSYEPVAKAAYGKSLQR